jgi:hypothetical protein
MWSMVTQSWFRASFAIGDNITGSVLVQRISIGGRILETYEDVSGGARLCASGQKGACNEQSLIDGPEDSRVCDVSA